MKRRKINKSEMPERTLDIQLPPVVINHTEIRGMGGNELFHVIMDVIFLLFGLLVMIPSLFSGHFLTLFLSVWLVVSITVRRRK